MFFQGSRAKKYFVYFKTDNEEKTNFQPFEAGSDSPSMANFFGQICWVLYFLLQGDMTSAITCGLSALMLAVFSKKDKWKWATSPVTVIFFIILLSGFSLLSFKVWSDIFPLSAGIFAVIANSRATEKRLRQFSLLWLLSWLMNSTFKMYPVAFLNDFMCTVSTIVALIRYREKRIN